MRALRVWCLSLAVCAGLLVAGKHLEPLHERDMSTTAAATATAVPDGTNGFDSKPAPPPQPPSVEPGLALGTSTTARLWATTSAFSAGAPIARTLAPPTPLSSGIRRAPPVRTLALRI